MFFELIPHVRIEFVQKISFRRFLPNCLIVVHRSISSVPASSLPASSVL
jgi:hypothetical protein